MMFALLNKTQKSVCTGEKLNSNHHIFTYFMTFSNVKDSWIYIVALAKMYSKAAEL